MTNVEQYSIGETDCLEIEWKWPERLGGNMEKFREQCTVVFALIVCKDLCIILCSPE